MAKTLIKRDSRSGKFVAGPLGRSKAVKFSLVEGVVLSEESSLIIQQHEAAGKNGAALRSAIVRSLRKKQ